MRRKIEKKDVDPLPLLLEAARRALREHLTRTPFSHPDIESEVVGMWNDITWARSDALRNQIKGHAREMGIRQ
jgi:hypothetical protein